MQAWEEFLSLQEREVGKEVVQKWLRPLKILRFDACNIYLEAKDSFQAIWFEEHIRHRTQTKLLNKNSKKIKVHLSVANAQEQQKNKRKNLENQKKLHQPSFHLNHDHLDPLATFENFVCSDKNLLSYKLLAQLAGYSTEASDNQIFNRENLTAFNPIYLCGRAGVGKTHLLMATAHCLQKQGLKVLYCRAETFTDHVVRAIRAGEMQEFRRLYRNIDVLIVDNIQIFSGKGSTQEEFFHTFNSLHVDNNLIILGADCPPQELKAIEPRLVSRFEWGITLPLEPLDRETMGKVLIFKAKAMDFPLNDKVTQYLLETFSSSTASLTRALESLVLHTHLEQSEGKGPSAADVDLDVAKIYLAELARKEKHSQLTPQRIIQIVAEFYGLRSSDILGKGQTREVTQPRQIAMHLCRQKLKMPYTKIGKTFSRDHSTVMSSIKQIQKSLDDKDQEIHGAINGITRTLESSLQD
ncbi:MAG: chromosomal replication initiator protein DnaA [Chlamydiota bacterium]